MSRASFNVVKILWSSSRKALHKRAGGRCAYCKCKLSVKSKGHRKRLTVDHVIPKSKGGTNSPDNLVAACKECNNAKGNKMPEEFV